MLVGWTLAVSVAEKMTTTKVVFPSTVVKVDRGNAEAEDETKVEMVPEAETFVEAADCDVWPSEDVKEDITEGLESMVASVGVVVSEEGVAALGVNVP